MSNIPRGNVFVVTLLWDMFNDTGGDGGTVMIVDDAPITTLRSVIQTFNY